MFDLFIIRDEYLKIKNIPGVYVLLSDDKVPLYVGKSVTLRFRVKSHLTSYGNIYIAKHKEKFYYIGIIYHENIKTLNSKESEIIKLLQPELNSQQANYPKSEDISFIKEYEVLVTPKCKQCGSYANMNGYCYIHDPANFYFSWIIEGKFITSEMQRLLYEKKYTQLGSYFYMNSRTFGKLLLEKTFAKVEFVNNEVKLKFKKHFIIIDELETIRLERYPI